MWNHATSSPRLLVVAALYLLAGQSKIAAQSVAQGSRISGTIVSKIDGHPLARARVTLRDAKSPDKFEYIVTSDDGRFAFENVPSGKYDLNGAKHGYISGSYDQHDQFSTAIVTGAGLETQSLVLRLAPSAMISGRILDENGDPVRHATVNLYFEDHSSGIDQIHQFRGSQTDDLGAYEIRPLMPGTYFLSVSARPWYALHPAEHASNSALDKSNFDRSLDVAYPLTYYSDVTEADTATPIPVRGGEHLQVDIHLNPVPSLHFVFRVPNNGNKGNVFPRLEQPTFDGSTVLETGITHSPSPGVVEVSGVPAGHYNIRFFGAASGMQMNGVDLTKDGEEVDVSKAEASGAVRVAVRLQGQDSFPAKVWLALRGAHKGFGDSQQINEKGEAQFQDVPPGRYTLAAFAPDRRYFVAQISGEGAEVSGHTVTILPGMSASLSVTLATGSVNVDGMAKRAGKPVAGAMIVLVPQNPENNRDLFRRDQSDLDGTFSLPNVVPGVYRVLAIENGWDLDWSQPAVIAAYSKGSRTIEVGSRGASAMHLPEAVEVQPK